jgi:hypothetical protein
MKADDAVNMAVKVAFVALVLHQLGLYQPDLWSRLGELPWLSIALASVSVAAIYSAFHDVLQAVAKGALWLAVVLGLASITVCSLFAFCLIQFGPADKSDRAFAAIMHAGNATFARLV